MAHGERAAKLQQNRFELWSRRPLSGWSCNAEIRLLSRRIERHREREATRREIENYYIENQYT